MSSVFVQWVFQNRIYVIVGVITLYSLMIVESFVITGRKGALKRGVCVARYHISRDIVDALRQVQADVRSRQWRIFRGDHQILVTKRDFSRLWYLWYFPYVGYIDLKAQSPVLECRTPFSNLVTWSMLIVSALSTMVFVPRLLSPSLDDITHHVVIGISIGVVLFNLFLFFAAHRDEVRGLRDNVMEVHRIR